ncbi:cyclic beta 1-2 glucan synthetase [Clostridium fermenticellae]|uniref:Cyclic beta 1-2 glucan synthetase n=1 Tax=Clostridium fermenticellae TaxID=2068654 RepID=A0A386H7D6_9CLOT|nr:glucoamylase family protein [Clostridium fermenticellae]AYD41465.1 cyclic beta 1-2 glucan synthetase [Clostridium fermenticellae]
MVFVIYYILATCVILLFLYLISRRSEYNNSGSDIIEDMPSMNASKEELKKHAIEISAHLDIAIKNSCKHKLIKNLDESYKKILNGNDYIDEKFRNKKDVLQCGEWILDNLYLIQREYANIKKNMPRECYKDIPVISKGIMKGYPRIYYIAVEMISYTDGKIDEDVIKTFIKAYQKNSVLTSGELWALPTMIKIALIQNISKITQRIVFAQTEREKAERIAEDIIKAVNSNNEKEELQKISSLNIKLTPHLVERILKTMRDNEVESQFVYKWIDEKLDALETDTNRIVLVEHQKQLSYQLSIGNSITSMREIGSLNWKYSFEELSYVENILRGDPSHIYQNMDFKSRDYYRHVIEKISRYVNFPESFIAKKAIECAKEYSDKVEINEYQKHVGYFIVDDGINLLSKKIGLNKNKLKFISTNFIDVSHVTYVVFMILSTLFVSSAIVTLIYNYDFKPVLWKYILAFIAVLIPVSEMIISIFNWSVSKLVEPRFVPKMNFEEGIPKEFSTMVIIPTLLNNEKKVRELFEQMEVYYLANGGSNIYFGILGDFKDSREEHQKSDEGIVNLALELVKNLNNKYSHDNRDIFYFFNRYRQYNKKEGIWLGWERKRGKVMEFNELVKGSKNTSYDVVSGDINNLNKLKYIITLDADTELPRDSAKKLVGAMAHILNRPYVNMKTKKVLRGHALMQPRVSISNLSANKTIFSKIFSGETGMDLYTNAISDVYEDLFSEGIFTGKGIYDIDVFSSILKDEIPENTVLSHDLLEGSYVRAALLTDVELIDGYPAYYISSCKRMHRWVRGDWQLIPWLFKKGSLNLLSRWKIFDNLRRSLIAPSIIILVVLSLFIFKNPDKWLVIAFISVLCPILFDVSESVVSPNTGIALTGKINSSKNAVEQVFLIFCFLPYQAYLMLDAVFRTLYRLLISRKNLLEWQTSADAEASTGKDLSDYIRNMIAASLIGLIIAAAAFKDSIDTGILLMPSVILWLLSPWIAYKISKDQVKKSSELTDYEVKVLRRLSRKTWAYFEDFVNCENNWLAPDNYQEVPNNGVAHRTSPTNIGMGLTSNVVAYDMGYIGIVELKERLNKIIKSMEGLERFDGHFLNWYDTKTKNPLYPRYVSTVDSGNLIGYVWLVYQALSDYLNMPIISDNLVSGLIDTLVLADYEIEKKLDLKDFYLNSIDKLKNSEFDLNLWKCELLDIWSKCLYIQKNLQGEKLYWNNKVKIAISKHINQIQIIFPWMDIFSNKCDEFYDFKVQINKIILKEPINKLCDKIDDLKLKYQIESPDFNIQKRNAGIFKELIENSKNEIKNLVYSIKNIQSKLLNISKETDFGLLYDEKKQLFSIGYNCEIGSIDKSYYDLMASEARQASFVSIAKGDVNQAHWFRLNRSLTTVGKSKALVSWSGTMFEYFMPLLIMKNYPDTLMDETYKSVIEGQKRYCYRKNIPWGISEAAFYDFDVDLNYQYKAFGVPGMGLKRGLMDDIVISPYSSAMALQLDLKDSFSNIEKLRKAGMEGRYGFYESVDYTKSRIPKDKNKAIVKCFMVHHQGMSLMAFDNVLNDNILQIRFHELPRVKATELLLQEKVPKTIIYNKKEKADDSSEVRIENQNIVRNFDTALTEIPETHIMSNGDFSVMVTNRGSGYAKKDDIMIYRWREDVTNDNKGMFIYIKNINSNEYWSSTYEPCKYEGENYKVRFSLDKAEFERKDGNIVTHTDVIVSSEDNAEIRNISITNQSEHLREIEITSYCEITMSPYNADLVHPAFGNLFIQTEYNSDFGCIIANRRLRVNDGQQHWMMQTVALDGEYVGHIQYETSRANFIGRGRNLTNPVSMDSDFELKLGVGSVIDPIISMRVRIMVEKGQTFKLAFTTGMADSREQVIELAKKYHDIKNVNREFELAWPRIQLELNYLGIKSAQANIYQIVASRILFLSALMADREKYIENIKKGQSSLWKYGISGDFPIVIAIITDYKDINMLKRILKAHEYWKVKGLKVDLLILNLKSSSYLQELQDYIVSVINSNCTGNNKNKDGGIFLYNRSTMQEDDIEFMFGIARIVLDCGNESVISQMKLKEIDEKIELEPIKYDLKKYKYPDSKFKIPELDCFNGIGGFERENNSYIILLKNGETTPAPWINVISNKEFGFHISESGVSYTWNKNSRENKLTAWSNDPVVDDEAEAVYIRDENTGKLWSISSKPINDNGEYLIEHGFGYSNFRHKAYGILGSMTSFVDMDESVKLFKVKLKNYSDEKRKLSVTYYAKLVLGVTHESTAQYIYTGFNNDQNYMYARNPYSEHFGNLICYSKIYSGSELSYTGDRKEFIGRGGSIEKPNGLMYKNFSNHIGAGMDPCMCQNVKIDLGPDEEKEILIILGQNSDFAKIEDIINKYSYPVQSSKVLNDSINYWKRLLGNIKVKTPDKSMDIMLNGWLLYQVIVCRYWSRTAFYQSGGAYGFRDQLQDVMAVEYADSKITRDHIIYSASRQYVDGDVQHWWHPIVESGIRTRFSDDLLWLPYVIIDYLKNTGDYSILDENSSYLEDEPLKNGEDERYNISKVSDKVGSIYEHCIKAIDRSLKFGKHNIPLMGSGDWNDGMNCVGNKGKGESVWLAWFLYSILDGFIPISGSKKDDYHVKRYTETKQFIKENLEKNAWDGSWYRRAYFDDGTPLGSVKNDECKIDSISQSWAVISKAAKKSRAVEAMDALEKNLVDYNKGIVKLLTPAFDKSSLNPGYIKGYIPGVRENGGQYTHAAVWVVLALIEMGYNNKAWRIFNMINPINHSISYLDCQTYKVEPYVMAADVYAVDPHVGRGGWTWYTGAAGWMYRTGIQGILGFNFKGKDGFTVNPCVPDEWKSYSIDYIRGECRYIITAKRSQEESIIVDGKLIKGDIIPFFEDGEHVVEVNFKNKEGL